MRDILGSLGPQLAIIGAVGLVVLVRWANAHFRLGRERRHR